MPERGFDNVESFRGHISGAGEIIFDGFENLTERPKGHENQKVKYSGKNQPIRT